jgi:hypothetical protein
MEIFFEDRAILKIVQLQDPQNVLNIPEEFPENVRLLRDFMYRGDEQLLSKKDLFKDKPLPILTKIKGIPLPVLERPFFDETTGKPNENGTLKPEDLKIKDGDKLENITGTGN